VTDRQSWRAKIHRQAYTDFSVPEIVPADQLAYWLTVLGQISYRAFLIVFWITLNCCTIAFGVFVEPLWRRQATFRRLQFPGRIPVIALALPILAAYSAYRTFEIYGLWHVILPFAAVIVTGAVFLVSLAGFNVVRRAVGVNRREGASGRRADRPGYLPEERLIFVSHDGAAGCCQIGSNTTHSSR
jgi:small-conductance mechanosensitive channel